MWAISAITAEFHDSEMIWNHRLASMIPTHHSAYKCCLKWRDAIIAPIHQKYHAEGHTSPIVYAVTKKLVPTTKIKNQNTALKSSSVMIWIPQNTIPAQRDHSRYSRYHAHNNIARAARKKYHCPCVSIAALNILRVSIFIGSRYCAA